MSFSGNGKHIFFLAPFNPVLESIDADSVVWSFNMRHNYNGRLSGIDDSSTRGVAVILAASSSDLSNADGYAVVNGEIHLLVTGWLNLQVDLLMLQT